MPIETTLERIAEALERIAQASEGKLVGSTTATLEDHPAAPKTEEPKKRTVKRKPEPEPEVEEPEFENVEEETEETEEEKPKAKTKTAKPTKAIPFIEVRTKFFDILNHIRAIKEYGPEVARDEVSGLLKEFCVGGKLLSEETIRPDQHQAFLDRVEELYEKYEG